MEKGSNKIIILLIILIAHSSQILSQIKNDTLNIGRNKIIFFYPEKSKVSYTYYEEGFFKDIICIEDAALIGLHYGCMVNTPLINHQDKNVTSEYIIANDFRQTRGFYYVNGDKKYFREDNVYKYGLNIYYSNVPEDKILFYESLLNSMNYLINQNE